MKKLQYLLYLCMFFGLSVSAPGQERDADAQREEPWKETVVPDPTPHAPIVHLNPDVPDFEAPEFEGTRYERMVPATLDPAERARLSVNCLSRTMNPNLEYTPYNMIELMSDPPIMWHFMGDGHTYGKYWEFLTLARHMCGSRQNIEADRFLRKLHRMMQGEDGLIYVPTSGRPWFLENTWYLAPDPKEHGKVDYYCTLGYGTCWTLTALSMHANLDPDGPWNKASKELFEAIKRIHVVEGDIAYMFDHWMMPGREIVKPESPQKAIAGGDNSWHAIELVKYYRRTGDRSALELAEKIMRFIMRDLGYFAEDGQFKEGIKESKWCHFHTHAKCMIACLYLAEETGDEYFFKQALQAYEYGKKAGNPVVGFFPEAVHVDGPEFRGNEHPYGYHTSETCEVADMIQIAIMLSKLGHDYWDDADRWTRNQLAANQYTESDWLTDGHIDYTLAEITDAHAERFYRPGRYTNDNVAERAIGGFASHPSANDLIGHPELIVSLANCCNCSGLRGFYYVWRDMLSFDKGRLRVNLLFNRASKHADIDSFLPYEGRVDIQAKRRIDLEVRLPGWVELDKVKCQVNGKAHDLSFKGRYAEIGKLRPGITATLTFPITERTEVIEVQGPPLPGQVNEYTVVLRGNTVVSIDPPGEYIPLYQRGHYRTGPTLFKKVERYVPDKEFSWW